MQTTTAIEESRRAGKRAQFCRSSIGNIGESAMAQANGIEPFSDFRNSLQSARYEALSSLPELRADAEAFGRMQAYLLTLYEGVEVAHSFIEHGGQVVDCIPAEQQL